MTKPATGSTLDKITFKDWLFALIGLLFVLSSLLIMQKDFNTGMTTLVFFGACFAVAVHIIIRKLRLQRQSLHTVTVTGGEPIYASKKRIALLGIGLLAFGSTLMLFQPDDNQIFYGISLLIATTGAVLLLGLFSGRLAKTYIQFDPAGFTFGYPKGKVSIAWEAIIDLYRGEIHNNPAVFLSVAPENIIVEPASYLAKVSKQMASSRKWTGADFVIMSSTYGIDAPVLMAAIERYITLPEARAELLAQRKLNEG
ncbi:putative membrane protein YeaQ/YmgE (transglycosylase-associated protein family) [Rheinheimera pacifica]|uniref:hypothetical protein n=1 Tax=Rheinheimera pacifica TaxID=173990 RepID=UPI00216A0CBB|nr:hypothetical protein [Rheinheimera pacifica]MCS4307634.1 putative membrane protein YeaQ/YmgE (transglycosylase-associated protein family) [Rheinheimera pacifica]